MVHKKVSFSTGQKVMFCFLIIQSNFFNENVANSSLAQSKSQLLSAIILMKCNSLSANFISASLC